MTSRIQLAKNWGISVFETHRIMAYAEKHHLNPLKVFMMYSQINQGYLATVAQNKQTKKWMGILYRYDLHHRPIIQTTTSEEYDTPLKAAQSLNKGLQTHQFGWATRTALNVPADSIILIKPVDERQFAPEKSIALTSAQSNRGARC